MCLLFTSGRSSDLLLRRIVFAADALLFTSTAETYTSVRGFNVPLLSWWFGALQKVRTLSLSLKFTSLEQFPAKFLT